MSLELQDAISNAADDDTIRALLLTGEGRAFCAGQDLAEAIEVGKETNNELGLIVRESYNPVILGLRNIEKPVICAVNGVAAGAGANLAYACDIVLASDQSSFIQSFSKIGLIPDSGGTFILPRLVGMQRATALAILGNKLTAEEARDYGLIFKVIPHDELMAEAGKMATKLAKQPTKGFGLIKRGLNQSLSNDLETQLELEAQLQTEAGHTNDYSEGVAAFLEKRKPEFKGN